MSASTIAPTTSSSCRKLEHLLEPDGRVFFAAEPILDDFPQPLGPSPRRGGALGDPSLGLAGASLQ